MMTKYSIYFYRIADLVRELFGNCPIEVDVSDWHAHDYRAVARFFVTGGIIASTEGTRLVLGYGSIVPQKIFIFEGSET